MEIIGNVNENPVKVYEYEWIITDFSTLNRQDGKCYYSPKFSFAGISWCLSINPNGHRSYDSVGYLSLFLRRKSAGLPFSQDYTLGLKNSQGKKDLEESCTFIFEKKEMGYGLFRCIARSKLLERKSELLPSDVLTVFCTLKWPTSTGDTSDAWISGSPFDLQENKVLQDFKDLYFKKEDCDVLIRVKGQEFPCHRAILKARSPVFASTFRYDMKEKATGVIDIEDCEPSSFSNFLCFLYCGDADTVCVGNVFSLFTVADKYDVQDLKGKCVEFMKENLSVDTFCSTITLAVRHSETELVTLATDFFIKDALKIAETTQWLSFSADNPTQSNELFIRALIAKDSNQGSSAVLVTEAAACGAGKQA